MSKIEEFDIIKKSLYSIISTSVLYKNKKVFVFFIKNGKAGGYINKAKTQKHLNTMQAIAATCASKPILAKAVDVSIMETLRSRHAQVFTQSIVDMAVLTRENNEYLILSAGGDGTSWEIQEILMQNIVKDKKTAKIIKEQVAFVQLALGTGNDGAEGKTLEESLSILVEGKSFIHKKAIRVDANKEMPEFGGKTAFAFNIASFGIDAFINNMTNKTKALFPGDFYKLWVNLGALFYESQYKIETMRVEIFDENGKLIKDFNEPFMLCVMGVSGKRTYGSGHKILPGNENFCLVKKIPLHVKIPNINSFKDGTHAGKSFSYLSNIHKMTIFYEEPILIQLDGEVASLDKDFFPVTMELVDFNVKKIQK